MLAGMALAFVLNMAASQSLHAAPGPPAQPAPTSQSTPATPLTPLPAPSASPPCPPLSLDVLGALSRAIENSPTLLTSLDRVRLAHCKIARPTFP